MQRDFNNKDFEHFVKQNADQYRMFPSEKVWQGINNTLHRRRRWYGIGLALLLLFTGTAVTLVMTNPPGSDSGEKTIASIFPQKQPADNNNVVKNSAKKTTAPAPAAPAVVQSYSLPLLEQQAGSIFPTEEAVTVYRTTESPANPMLSQAIMAPTLFAENLPAVSNYPAGSFMNNKNISSIIMAPVPTNSLLNSFSNETPAAITQPEIRKQPETIEHIHYSNDPLPVAVAVAGNKTIASKRKFSMQFYITPTVSYRKLTENKKFLQAAANNGTIPLYAAYSDINNYVNHKPDMGLELGFAGKYALTEKLKVRAGLQFNVSRYDIKAAYEQFREDATIALEGDAFNNQTQTITRKTNYRNFGNNTNWLKNLYYSVSLPIGAELTFKSQTKTHFGIAATFQPTYIIKDRAYLITTDYKNYVEVPSLVRKWNMNTSFETFIAYSTGNINWQVGPQIRYQIQSSFNSKYPVKENLFDFGLKVGIQLNR